MWAKPAWGWLAFAPFAELPQVQSRLAEALNGVPLSSWPSPFDPLALEVVNKFEPLMRLQTQYLVLTWVYGDTS